MTNETDVNTSENVNENWGGNDKVIDWEKRALRAEAKIIADKQKATAPVKEDEAVEKKEEASVEKNEENTTAPTKETTPKKTIEELQAEIDAIKADKEIEANIETSNMMTTPWVEKTTGDTNVYNMSDLEKMSQEEYNKAKDRIDSWEATVNRED